MITKMVNKLKNIKVWRIKPELIGKDKVQSTSEILLKAMNGNLGNFSNFNQAIGAVSEAVSPNHLQVLFETYTTFGIFDNRQEKVCTYLKGINIYRIIIRGTHLILVVAGTFRK